MEVIKMENIIKQARSFEDARKFADENEKEKGIKTVVRRILTYTDWYNQEPRYHYRFDIVEILN